nr:hypothetical protein Iba_chr04aCG16590 [Ipomoea batatas]
MWTLASPIDEDDPEGLCLDHGVPEHPLGFGSTMSWSEESETILEIYYSGQNPCRSIRIMGRTKELAKKRKFDRASSSRDPEEAILGTRALKLNAIQLAKVEKLRTL